MPFRMFQVSQKALIDRDGAVLVVYFPSGGLDFPGGRVDEGEHDLVASLKREVREETRLEVDVGPPFMTLLGADRDVCIIGSLPLYRWRCGAQPRARRVSLGGRSELS
ncbi:MAG TPA: NUDIX domain-containing protein [Dehalococcoidia bacterium]|nr:NUDIX domain-containing protein [Dehalococcoidia bacterium]